jgi:hypothetical protein
MRRRSVVDVWYSTGEFGAEVADDTHSRPALGCCRFSRHRLFRVLFE